MTLSERLRASIAMTLKDRLVFARTFVDALIFLKKNRAIFDNREILIAWHCSFGHPSLGIDWTARLYYPNRVSMIYIDHPRANPFLPQCYLHTYDLFRFEGSVAPLESFRDEIRYRAVRAAVLLVTAFDGKGRHNILSIFQAYRTMGMSDGEIKIMTVKGLPVLWKRYISSSSTVVRY